MTLATHVAIPAPLPVGEVFEECCRMVGADDPDGVVSWTEEDHLGNRVERTGYAQGLAAAVRVRSGQDGPVRLTGPGFEDEDDGGPDRDVEVTFDVAGDASCGVAMHLVGELDRWLAERGVEDAVWCDEYTGEWAPTCDTSSLSRWGDTPERGRAAVAEVRDGFRHAATEAGPDL